MVLSSETSKSLSFKCKECGLSDTKLKVKMGIRSMYRISRSNTDVGYITETNVAKRAPILICAITKKTYSDNGAYNKLHFHDLGAANENMFLESFNQGLIMHEMGGFDREQARREFNIPDDYEVGIMIAIGYQDSFQVLPERYREAAHLPRKRKPLSEIASFAELGNGVMLDQLSK